MLNGIIRIVGGIVIAMLLPTLWIARGEELFPPKIAALQVVAVITGMLLFMSGFEYLR